MQWGCTNAFPQKNNFWALGNTGDLENMVRLVRRFRDGTLSHASPPELDELALGRVLEP